MRKVTRIADSYDLVYERRRLERFELQVPAKIEVLSSPDAASLLELLTKDICAGGAYFPTKTALAAGTKVKMDILLPVRNAGPCALLFLVRPYCQLCPGGRFQALPYRRPRGQRRREKPLAGQTAKEGEAGCPLASVGLGRDFFGPCEKQLLRQMRKSDTETGMPLLHLI